MGTAVATSDPASSGPLSIRLLGTIELTRNGVVLPLPASRRTRALLGYLIATGAPQSRQALCELLWEGPDDPRAELRWSLTKLRAVVDESEGAHALRRLAADREQVAFVADRCTIDIAVLRSLTAAGVGAMTPAALAEAARLLQREFLDGLDLPGCYRFHHWCIAERERHGTLRRAVLEALIACHRHDPEQALSHGRALVAADPLNEAAHATLIRLLIAAGRYPDAEQHYAWASDLLRREVAMPAGGPLDQAIRQGRRDLRAGAGTGTGAGASTGEPDGDGSAAARTDAAAADIGARERANAAGGAGTVDSADAAGGADGAYGAHAAASVPADAPSPRAPSSSAPSATAAADEEPGHGELVGRAAERAAIARALAGEAGGRLLLFVGEPGIGKTRLLDHLADAAGRAGRHLIRGRCFEAETARPYGLWLDALRGIPTGELPDRILAEAAPLLAAPVAADGDRERLFGAAVTLLRRLAATRPVVVLLDDLQWIDEGSAALLHFVARSFGDPARLLLAGAARAGEIDENPCARGLLQSLRRDDRLQRLDPAPLAGGEARMLLGPEVSGADADEALRRSGGNPLYLLELARAARRGAGPANGNGGGGRSLDELIDDRIGSLDEPSRELLAWAAAMGRALQPDLLATAAGLPVADVLSRFERFARRGLVTISADGQFDFVHDLLRQAVYRQLSQPRRRTIHRQIMRTLIAASAEDPWLHGDVVHHASLAGDALAAARACLAAGEHCLRVHANAEAATVAERGLDQLGGVAHGAERVRLEIGLLRLRVAAASSPGGRRLPALAERIEQAIAAAEALALHPQAAAGWEILAFWQQHANDPDLTRQATLAAERITRHADAATHCMQLANSGRCLMEIEAEPTRARALLDEAATLADRLQLKVMEIDWGRGLTARAAGDLDTARDALARAVMLARLADNHWREHECRIWQATIDYERGDHAGVLMQADAIVGVARRMGEDSAPFAQALAALSRLRLADGGADDEADAGAALAASIVALRERDDKAHLAYVLNEAAALACDSGDTGTARVQATEALDCARALRRRTEIAVATALLARASSDASLLTAERPIPTAGSTGTARPPGTTDAADTADDWPPSARAAAAFEAAAHALGGTAPAPRIPTPAPTPAA